MDALLTALVVALCVLLFVGSVCRLDLLHAAQHRSTFIYVYTLSAIFAAGTAFAVLERAVDWYELTGVGALLMHLYATRELWKHGAPSITLKG